MYTARKLAVMFNLSKYFVRRSKGAVRKWPIQFGSVGRPALLNSSQQNELKSLKSNGGYDPSFKKVIEKRLLPWPKLMRHCAARQLMMWKMCLIDILPSGGQFGSQKRIQPHHSTANNSISNS